MLVVDTRPEVIRQSLDESLGEARLRPCGPVLPASHRQESAHRGIRRRAGRTGARREGASHRAVGMQRRDVAQGPCGVSGCRRAERILHLVARAGKRNARRLSGTGHWFCRLQSAGPRFPGRQLPSRQRTCRPTMPGKATRDSRTKTPTGTRGWSWHWRPLQRTSGASPAQVALAWVLSRAPEVVAIPGMKTRSSPGRQSCRWVAGVAGEATGAD